MTVEMLFSGMRLILLILALIAPPTAALAQSCPAPLATARKLVLVTPQTWTSSTARLQRFTRLAPGRPWQPESGPVSALVGRNGVGWSIAFRGYAFPGEPIKQEGDKRAPIGFFNIGHSFGFAPSPRVGYLQITPDTVCVNDLRSSAYNRIASRGVIGPNVRGEPMRRIPEYVRGLLIDYPTDARDRAGSCVFIHTRLPGATGTGGCVALAESEVTTLQDFAQSGAVLAIVPKPALLRFRGCLPQ
jgi:L,D-peptidoglycan transpeptidase YkuD (ErfK/YbiS/YcfS/YnhG family)